LSLCVAAHEKLTGRGIRCRVVSMPSFELFEDQEQSYRESVLPPSIAARVAVEAGIRQSWDRYLGPTGRFVGMTRFGASGPYQQLYSKFGITVEHVISEALTAAGKA
jgi:transketolase